MYWKISTFIHSTDNWITAKINETYANWYLKRNSQTDNQNIYLNQLGSFYLKKIIPEATEIAEVEYFYNSTANSAGGLLPTSYCLWTDSGIVHIYCHCKELVISVVVPEYSQKHS